MLCDQPIEDRLKVNRRLTADVERCHSTPLIDYQAEGQTLHWKVSHLQGGGPGLVDDDWERDVVVSYKDTGCRRVVLGVDSNEGNRLRTILTVHVVVLRQFD
jgi:hypothetical protein